MSARAKSPAAAAGTSCLASAPGGARRLRRGQAAAHASALRL